MNIKQEKKNIKLISWNVNEFWMSFRACVGNSEWKMPIWNLSTPFTFLHSKRNTK